MSQSAPSKVGHGLAKVLGIKLDYRNELGKREDKISRGESVFSVETAQEYIEEEPRTMEWINNHLIPSRQDCVNYVSSLFPFTHWILRYNLQWLIGDLIAGITVGAVVVPQSMAYAKLAELPVQFGLYSAFMGVLIYWVFATSKDITIGPVAVMSTIVGDVVLAAADTHPQFQGYQVASALAIIIGSIITFLGIIRLGRIVDFISLTAITAFITGSSIFILVGQIPGLLGISKKYVDSRAATYEVVIGVLTHLKHCKLDAAMGLTALTMLYLYRFSCNQAAKKWPQRKKLIFFINTLRTVFVILLYTMISWLANMHLPHDSDDTLFKVLGTVPRGFEDVGTPIVNTTIIQSFTSKIPVTVIVALIEHIAISKSFGRINNYTINPSQELIAIGVTNLLGPFLGAYPATGSFTRTAIKSKAGVRSPLAGIITAIVVLLAIYALTAVFWYIPNAVLSAVIIHAVGDLIAPPNTVYQFWRVSPFEVIIFFAGVIVTVFTSIEIGVYVTVSVSAAMLLWRILFAKGQLLGQVTVKSVVGKQVGTGSEKYPAEKDGSEVVIKNADVSVRTIFVPYNHNDGSNPGLEVQKPYPGVFIYRFSEGFTYPNCSYYMEKLVEHVFAESRKTNPNSYPKPGDRPWNDPGPKKGEIDAVDNRPTLKAVILDMSSVNNMDITSTQILVDVRNQLDRYASPDTVEWHFANLNNRWAKRALATAGFGYPSPKDVEGDFHRWKPIFSVAEMGGFHNSAAADAEERANKDRRTTLDIESGNKEITTYEAEKEDSASSENGEDFSRVITNSRAYAGRSSGKQLVVVHGVNRPFFHVDLTSALQSVITSVERKEKSGGYSQIKAE